MASNLPPLPNYSHLVTPARRTNTFQGGQRPSHIIKLASSTMSLNGNETPLNKTHLFSPTVNSQSPSTSNDHLLKYDIRRLRASLERKEEQISWWMEKAKNDSQKFEGQASFQNIKNIQIENRFSYWELPNQVFPLSVVITSISVVRTFHVNFCYSNLYFLSSSFKIEIRTNQSST